jgi:hypothetical protein
MPMIRTCVCVSGGVLIDSLTLRRFRKAMRQMQTHHLTCIPDMCLHFHLNQSLVQNEGVLEIVSVHLLVGIFHLENCLKNMYQIYQIRFTSI